MWTGKMRLPRNIKIACNHRGLTHYGGIFFFQEFLRVLQFRRFLAQQVVDFRPHHDYSLSQMTLAVMYPILLGLDRLENAAFLRTDPTFQYLTGLPSYPDPQSLRRFLLHAPPEFRQQLHRLNDRFLQRFIHQPEHRSRLILDLDSTVVTVFGFQEGAAVGYNPRYRGKRSYDPLLCVEANSSLLWDTELRRGDAGTWARSEGVLASCFLALPSDIREVRVRADAGFGYNPVLEILEQGHAHYAVVARMTSALQRRLGGLHYHRLNPRWEIAECEHRVAIGAPVRRCIVARRPLEETEGAPTLFTLARYAYRAWWTNLPLSPAGLWHFYEGRAGMEPRIGELREHYALRKIPTEVFEANALYLEIIRLAYNLMTAFQRTCLPEDWQPFTLRTLRYRLLWLPGELTRPQNRPTLRLANSPLVRDWTEKILRRIQKLKPLDA
jgi:hypothetical protein